MDEQRRSEGTSEVGITHFPLEEEQARQEKVDEKAAAQGQSALSSGTHHGHRLSRQADPPAPEESEGTFEGKGGKGGKTGGSRAGLLSSSQKAGKGRK